MIGITKIIKGCRTLAIHIPCKLNFTFLGPMTIADEYYGERAELAMVLSAMLHDKAPELGE